MPPASKVSCTWSHGHAVLHSLGSMLAPVNLTLPDGRNVSPLHIAPWVNEVLPADTAPVLRTLRGEWPCVPFGADNLATLNSDWKHPSAIPEALPHGYSSNSHWHLQSSSDRSVGARIDYPADSDVSSLERRIGGVPGKARLNLELAIHTRVDTCLPVGLHPIFRLPEDPHSVLLNPGVFGEVWVHPGDTGGPSLFAPGARYQSLSAIPGLSGGCINAGSLPFGGNSENLLLLTGTQGRFELLYLTESHKIVLEWNAEHFPCVMLWISNRGRQQAPWLGRHLAIGIEPVCAAFDLGVGISTSDNPLSREGIKTAVSFSANSSWQTVYSITAESI